MLEPLRELEMFNLNLIAKLNHNLIEQECPLKSEDELNKIEQQIKGKCSDDEWRIWKLYKKSNNLIFKNHLKGIFNVSEEIKPWLGLDTVARKGMPKIIKDLLN